MDSTQQSLDILIVEDHQMFIDGMKLLLKQIQRINNIYEALNGKAAIEIIKKQNIDLVITDINMPEMSGLELSRNIKADYPNIKILVLSQYNFRPDQGLYPGCRYKIYPLLLHSRCTCAHTASPMYLRICTYVQLIPLFPAIE